MDDLAKMKYRRYYDENIQYFGQDHVITFKFRYGGFKKNEELTYLRKIGDSFNQYVTSIRYLDTCRWNYDNTEIYAEPRPCDFDDDDKLVYSVYHSDCDTCQQHCRDAKENLIIGFKIYPVGMFPMRTRERKENWKSFKK